MTALDKAGLVALAERVEALTGTCRETDALIVRAVYGNDGAPIPFAVLSGNSFDYLRRVGGLHVEIARIGNGFQPSDRYVPRFTASLDAAMTLVPGGFSFEVRASGLGDKGQATVWNPMTQPGLPSHKSWTVRGCNSPALALTAAALRAIAAGQP